tara:strand:+ start:4839 stop:5018 length:180 start_codon:yes stop_codon:yes gene_type:complete
MGMTNTDKHGRPIVTMIGRAGTVIVSADQQAYMESQGYALVVKAVAKKKKPKKAKKSEE